MVLKSFISLILTGATLACTAQLNTETDPNIPVSAKSSIKSLNAPAGDLFKVIKNNEYTPVKNQGMTGTCWAFSTTAVVESKVVKEKQLLPDVSEMYSVRQMYIEKARNYVLRQGNARFSEGGLGHDLIHAMATYGAMPESIYSGLPGKSTMHNHAKLFSSLKLYLDNCIATKTKGDKKDDGKTTENWEVGFMKILDGHLGVPPQQFKYNGQNYTPKTFATDFLGFKEDDYVNLTSFTHHPFYKPFILEVPDNFSNGAYYNLPIDTLTDVVKNALKNGYTVLWDADVSNEGFNQQAGLAMFFGDREITTEKVKFNPDAMESKWDVDKRQGLYEDLITQDDHLMQITGIETSPGGKIFFIVKNSWGNTGPYKGFIHVSEAYFGMNTISLVVPKAGITKAIKEKLNIH